MKKLTTLLIIIVVSACTVYRAQHASQMSAPPPVGSSEPAAHAHHAPDDQAVDRFEGTSTDQKQATLITQLDLYKKDLAAAGKYDCCVKPGCNECAIRAGECHCRRVIEKNGPCCGECTMAWIDGRGDVPGIDKEQVLKNLGCYRELYEKPVPPGEVKPGTKPDTE